MFAAGGDGWEAAAPRGGDLLQSHQSPGEVLRGRERASMAAKVIEVQTRLAPLKNVLMDALIDVEEATRGIHDFAEARRLRALCMVPGAISGIC